MSFPNDNALTPSTQDCLSPLNRGGFGFADEQPADAFPEDELYTPEEEEQMRQQYLARLAAEAAARAGVA